MKFISITHLNAFASNVLLALKIMNFEDVVLNHSFLCDKKH
jgi:hypothetical protein